MDQRHPELEEIMKHCDNLTKYVNIAILGPHEQGVNNNFGSPQRLVR